MGNYTLVAYIGLFYILILFFLTIILKDIKIVSYWWWCFKIVFKKKCFEIFFVSSSEI